MVGLVLQCHFLKGREKTFPCPTVRLIDPWTLLFKPANIKREQNIPVIDLILPRTSLLCVPFCRQKRNVPRPPTIFFPGITYACYAKAVIITAIIVRLCFVQTFRWEWGCHCMILSQFYLFKDNSFCLWKKHRFLPYIWALTIPFPKRRTISKHFRSTQKGMIKEAHIRPDAVAHFRKPKSRQWIKICLTPKQLVFSYTALAQRGSAPNTHPWIRPQTHVAPSPVVVHQLLSEAHRTGQMVGFITNLFKKSYLLKREKEIIELGGT